MLKCIEMTTLVLLIYLTAHYIQSKLENEFHSIIIRYLHYHNKIMKRAYSCMVVDDPYESNNDPVFSEDSISSFNNDSDVDDLGYTDNTLRLKKILSLYRHICRMPKHAPIKLSEHERKLLLSLLKNEMP